MAKVHPLDLAQTMWKRHAELRRVFAQFHGLVEQATEPALPWVVGALYDDGHAFDVTLAGVTLRCLFSARRWQDGHGVVDFFVLDRLDVDDPIKVGSIDFARSGYTVLKHFSEDGDGDDLCIAASLGAREVVAGQFARALANEARP